jgi:enoyl-CoA hydratase/carnithine racemase
MDSETILCEKKGRITYITLNRPEVLNAINNTLRRELLAAVEEFDRDEEAWVAILSGAGRAFCSGGDVKDREGPDPRLVHGPGMLPASNLLLSCANGKPVIAAVHGYAVGGGLFYTLACDLAVAADNTKFQFTEVPLGQQVAEAESLAEDIMSYPQESVCAQVRISRWYGTEGNRRGKPVHFCVAHSRPQ